MATRAGLAASEGRIEANLAGAVDKMPIARIAGGGLIVALVKPF